MILKPLMSLVLLESPFAAPTPEGIGENLTYLRACMRDCLARWEAPIASHGLYTQPGVLDDAVREERERGMRAGWEWLRVVDAVVVYTDRGISPGMQAGIERARQSTRHVPITMRQLGHK